MIALLVIAIAVPTSPGQDIAAPVEALQLAVERAIERASPSVVALARVRKGSGLAPSDPDFVPTEFASGVVIGRDGLILTNHHVLGNPDENEYWVWTRGTPYRVLRVERPKGADPWMDLAVLVVGADDLTPIAFGDGGSLRKGQFVVGLGNPHGIARDGDVSASLGIVSNLGRKAPPRPGQEERESLHELGTLIQTDIRLPLGASGGALVNLKGELVGLTTSLAAQAGAANDSGYAIPVNDTFKRVVEQLAAGKRVDFGYLGVQPGPLTLAARREGESGVLVEGVMVATPASQAGLRRGDILRSINDHELRDTADVMLVISSLLAGDEVSLMWEREGERTGGARGGSDRTTLRRTVRLTKKRPVAGQWSWSESPPERWRGALVEYVTAMPDFPFHSYKVDADGCVGVLDVERDSPAWQAGLRPGQYVSHVEGRRVSTPAAFLQEVASREGDIRLTRPADRGRAAEELVVR